MRIIIVMSIVLIAVSGCTEFKRAVNKLPKWRGSPKVVEDIEDKKKTNSDVIYTGDVIGGNENVAIIDSNLPLLKAKLDSSLPRTDLDVNIIKTYKVGDKEFVQYEVKAEGEGANQKFDKEIVRWETVSRTDGQFKRPIVKMQICLGVQKINTEVRLADKGHFLYPFIIGKNVIKERFIVDRAKSFTTNPACK